MPERFYVTPKPEFKIRRPDTGRHLEEEGAWQRDRIFWRRREIEGAVTICAKAPSETNSKKSEKGA